MQTQTFGSSAGVPTIEPESRGPSSPERYSLCCSKKLKKASLHAKRPSRRSTPPTSPDRPRSQVRPGYACREDPAAADREATLTQTRSEAAQFTLPLLNAVLNKTEAANLLSVPVTWVATHWTKIPGAFHLGRNLRFRRALIGEWLGGSSPLLPPEQVADILKVNKSWIYAHADQIPGVIRLGYYVRFKPAVLMGF